MQLNDFAMQPWDWELLTTVLAYLQCERSAASSAESTPVMQQSNCDSTKCSWSCFYQCTVSCHFTLFSSMCGTLAIVIPPLPYYSPHFFPFFHVLTSCTIVLYNGMDIPVNNAYSIWYHSTKSTRFSWRKLVPCISSLVCAGPLLLVVHFIEGTLRLHNCSTRMTGHLFFMWLSCSACY